MNKEILRMQIRLFRLACKKWNKKTLECAEIFDKYDVDKYISELYELFHVQGDDANLDDIETYLENNNAGYIIR